MQRVGYFSLLTIVLPVLLFQVRHREAVRGLRSHSREAGASRPASRAEGPRGGNEVFLSSSEGEAKVLGHDSTAWCAQQGGIQEQGRGHSTSQCISYHSHSHAA